MFKKIVVIVSFIIVSIICLIGCDFNFNDKKGEFFLFKNLDKVIIVEVIYFVFYVL